MLTGEGSKGETVCTESEAKPLDYGGTLSPFLSNVGSSGTRYEHISEVQRSEHHPAMMGFSVQPIFSTTRIKHFFVLNSSNHPDFRNAMGNQPAM